LIHLIQIDWHCLKNYFSDWHKEVEKISIKKPSNSPPQNHKEKQKYFLLVNITRRKNEFLSPCQKNNFEKIGFFL